VHDGVADPLPPPQPGPPASAPKSNAAPIAVSQVEDRAAVMR